MAFFFHTKINGVLHKCLEKGDLERVLKELHDRLVDDQYGEETKTHKIIQVGY